MKKLALSALCLFAFLASVHAQQTVTLFSEDFNGATADFNLNTADVSSNTNGYNDWVINNIYTGGSGTIICLGFPFTITIANTPTQPVGITGSPNSNYLHILADDGVVNNVFNANYRPADGTCTQAENNFAGMSTDISTVGYINVDFSFYWMHGGSPATVGEVYYSTNGGSSWTQLTAPVASYQNQLTWTQQSISNPIFDNQPTLRFGYRLSNTVSTAGAEPSFSIDEIVVTGEVSCTPTFSSASAAICQGDSVLLAGAFQTTSGSYVDTLTNATNCDSLITTQLTVDPGSTINATASICDGNSIMLGGIAQTTAGVYTDVFQNAAGCDSLVVTTLTVNPVFNMQAIASICDGDSILLGGTFQTASGTYTDALASTAGCDSIVITTLTVNLSYNQTASADICPGESILLGGTLQTTSGVYTDQFMTAAGCDSLVVTTLTVGTPDTSVTFNSGTLTSNASSATYQWLDCTTNAPIASASNQSYTPTLSGNYAVVVTQGNCSDTSSCQFVFVVGLEEAGLAATVQLYPNPVKNELQINLGDWYRKVEIALYDVTGKKLMAQALGGQSAFEVNVASLPKGMYFLQLVADGEQATFRIIKE